MSSDFPLWQAQAKSLMCKNINTNERYLVKPEYRLFFADENLLLYVIIDTENTNRFCTVKAKGEADMKYLPILQELFESDTIVFWIIGLVIAVFIGLRLNSKKQCLTAAVISIAVYAVCEAVSNIRSNYMTELTAVYRHCGDRMFYRFSPWSFDKRD